MEKTCINNVQINKLVNGVIYVLLADPHVLAGVEEGGGGLSRRSSSSSSSLGSLVRQPWFIAVLGCVVFLLLSLFLVAVFFRRRMAWKKALGGQINGTTLGES